MLSMTFRLSKSGSPAEGLRVFNNIPASKAGSLAEGITDSKGHSGFTKMGFVDGKGHSGFVGNFLHFVLSPGPLISERTVNSIVIDQRQSPSSRLSLQPLLLTQKISLVKRKMRSGTVAQSVSISVCQSLIH
jgi:hypothetical protein